MPMNPYVETICGECGRKNENKGTITYTAKLLRERHWSIGRKEILCPTCNGFVTCPACYSMFEEGKVLICLAANIESCPDCKTDFDTTKGGLKANAQIKEDQL